MTITNQTGLGRTGVLIACYLVYSLKVNANDAIRYVRLKRPGSVQTRGQILSVRHFAQFVLPRTITYYLKENINQNKYMSDFTLSKFLKRQRVILHGYDERKFRHFPKIIHCICERILKLCGCWIDEFTENTPLTLDFLYTKLNGNISRFDSSYSLSSGNSDSMYFADLKSLSSPSDELYSPVSPNSSENGDPSDSCSELSTIDGDEIDDELLIENRCFQELETQKDFTNILEDELLIIQDINVAIDALLMDFANLPQEMKIQVKQYQHEINSSQIGWAKLAIETDLKLLASLLFEWVEKLKHPVLGRDHFEYIVIFYKQPETCFQKFPAEDAYVIEYLLRFLSKIQPCSKDNQSDLIKRIIAACSKQTLQIQGKFLPSEKGFKKLRDGTLACSLEFFESLFEIVARHHSIKRTTYLHENKDYNATNTDRSFQ